MCLYAVLFMYELYVSANAIHIHGGSIATHRNNIKFLKANIHNAFCLNANTHP